MAYLTKSYVLRNSLTFFFFLATLPNMQPEVSLSPAAREVQGPNYWITYFSFVILCVHFSVSSPNYCTYSYIYALEKGKAIHSGILA